ncbi:hypothetical protein CRI94_15620 [Longibacter salinarum]|uniref:Uncharacterized protein n=1 Tax=Longibacter salinarum TaxID=1850348 RepID=A0A2A8CUN3_9BACT|nr:MgtC/SapB family protein [Longibacter salinarum]PEN11460.1 hypothetical protein CRI94_15620 [Longibacter salinarum]
MDASLPDLFYRFGAALVIGLLIGLQREYAFQEHEHQQEDELLAGARTFPLISLLGASFALLADVAQAPALLAMILAGVAVLLGVAHYQEAKEANTGLTTEIAALLTLSVGMLCAWDEIELAAALGVATTVLLALKVQTRSFAKTISREDVFATLKFAVITAVILPILPQQGYGPPPFDVLVPYDVWLIVILISGISFLGYVAIQVVGARRGVGLTGILGGLASSTAVTLSLAQRSRDAPSLARSFSMGVVLAWTVMFLRVLVEVAAVNVSLLRVVGIPILAMMAAGILYAVYLYMAHDSGAESDATEMKNPFRLTPAITFGILYAVILVATSAAQNYFGDAGIYVTSLVSGLADVDAITLSMARLSGPAGDVEAETAARAIVIGAAANTLLKGGIVFFTGTKSIRRPILGGMAAIIATAAATIWFI